MLRFVLHKLISKRWLALCLLIGDILLVAIASSNPLYSDAILQRALTKDLSNSLSVNNAYPAEFSISRSTYNNFEERDQFFARVEEASKLNEKWGVTLIESSEEHSVTSTKAVMLGIRGDGKFRNMNVGCMSDLEEHITVVAGKMMANEMTSDGVVEAIISEGVQRQRNYLIGDEFEIHELILPNGQPVRVKIVGIYRSSDAQDVYWNKRSVNLNANVLISEDIFKAFLMEQNITTRFSFYVDYTEITPEMIPEILKDMSLLHESLEEGNLGIVNENLSGQLSEFLPQATQFQATLTVLYAPVYALLAAFIFMVSRQIMDLEENEIAVIVSRGSKKWQIVTIYFIQAVIMSVLGILFGYPLGFLICQLLGSSNAFLEFVQRQALPLRLTLNSFTFAAVAGAGACAFMTLPVLKYANRSIVQYKVQKQAQNNAPLWQKLFLDVILVGVSVYALYSFNNQKTNLIQQVLRGDPLDPLLYFSSSVFIVGAGLLCMRFLPLLIRLIYRVGKKLWSPAFYTAFLRVIRTKNQQSFIMIFLVMTIALGIFNSASARTINANAENQIEYMNAVDVAVQEFWEAPTQNGYMEPNFAKYSEIEGVESITKVYYTQKASIKSTTESISDIHLMGIHTKEFGETVEFDSSLLDTHLNHYLNAMSQDASGIIVSSNFRDVKGYALGDVITYRDGAGTAIEGIIYGFVDYWPGFPAVTMSISEEGNLVQKSNYLIVASLSQLQVNSGIQPYQVWMKMTDSSQPVYDFAAEKHMTFALFRDTTADLISLKNEPLFQGTNGILTANFIIVLMLCMVGFLIYWILSIRSRELQFGIFRAMGLSMREVIGMLGIEQVLISGSSILIGVLVGALTTKLYLPLIQIAYSADNQVLPLQTTTYISDAFRLFGAIAFMVIFCMIVLAWLISKIRIAQALKLGED